MKEIIVAILSIVVGNLIVDHIFNYCGNFHVVSA